MIGKITGRVDYVAEDHVLIEAAGVGYVVYCAPATLRALPGPGEVAAVYTEMVVREDLMQLYGFRSMGEREWHRLLTSVQGVGAKVSLAIIDRLGMPGLAKALATGDAGAFRQAQGVGPKLATRIATELKGKAPAMMALGGGSGAPARPAAHPAAAPRAAPVRVEHDTEMRELSAVSDALSALVNLGYDRGEAAAAVAEAAGEGADESGALIREALKLLGRQH